MTSYPPPEQNPKCICPTAMAAFFCPTGHMLECHYPMTCDEAQCSHLARYQGDEEDGFESDIPEMDPLP